MNNEREKKKSEKTKYEPEESCVLRKTDEKGKDATEWFLSGLRLCGESAIRNL